MSLIELVEWLAAAPVKMVRINRLLEAMRAQSQPEVMRSQG